MVSTESLRGVGKQEPTSTPMQPMPYAWRHYNRDVKYSMKFHVDVFCKQKKKYSMKVGASSLLIPDKTVLRQGKLAWLWLPCCWGLSSKRVKEYQRDFTLDDKVQGAEGSKHHRLELVKVDVLPTESHAH